ncbi:hypothetical protein EOM86_10090, partial [Candidatus Nomurabacteria bacterium]|nr:hypothetical protein [Candidatus Nomurabacteria bacterium]
PAVRTIKVIFDNEFDATSTVGNFEISSSRPQFLAKTSDITASPALVAGRSILEESDTLIHSKMIIDAAGYLNQNGWRSKIYTPAVQDMEQNVIDELETDIRQKKVKFVIMISYFSGKNSMWAQECCEVPWIDAFQQSRFDINDCEYLRDIINKGFLLLIKKGYQSIGLLYSDYYHEVEDYVNRYLNDFQKNYPKPIKITKYIATSLHPESGIEVIQNRLDVSNMPEVLFCLDDNLCRGAIIGLLSKNITFPEKIGLITHANEGVGILSPVQLTQLEYSPRKVLHANIDKMIGLIHGKDETVAICNTLKIIQGSSCLDRDLMCRNKNN